MPNETESQEDKRKDAASDDSDERRVFDARRAVLGGVTAAGIGLAFTVGIGGVAPYEVPDLMRPLISTCQYWYGAMITVSATIVALMLTSLSLSTQTDKKLKRFHYRRLRTIARLGTAVFVASTLLLLLVGLPFENADTIPQSYFSYVYYFVASSVAVVAGLVVTTMLLLYSSVAETIAVVGLTTDGEHPLLRDEDS